MKFFHKALRVGVMLAGLLLLNGNVEAVTGLRFPWPLGPWRQPTQEEIDKKTDQSNQNLADELMSVKAIDGFRDYNREIKQPTKKILKQLLIELNFNKTQLNQLKECINDFYFGLHAAIPVIVERGLADPSIQPSPGWQAFQEKWYFLMEKWQPFILEIVDHCNDQYKAKPAQFSFLFSCEIPLIENYFGEFIFSRWPLKFENFRGISKGYPETCMILVKLYLMNFHQGRYPHEIPEKMYGNWLANKKILEPKINFVLKDFVSRYRKLMNQVIDEHLAGF